MVRLNSKFKVPLHEQASLYIELSHILFIELNTLIILLNSLT